MKRPRNDKFKTWLAFAGEDIEMARLAMDRGIYNQVCFHSQQIAEKSLKAYLKAEKGSIPKVHNLLELVTLCSQINSCLADLRNACEYLNRFYAPTRYPDAFPGSLAERLPNEKEASRALDQALKVYDKIYAMLNK